MRKYLHFGLVGLGLLLSSTAVTAGLQGAGERGASLAPNQAARLEAAIRALPKDEVDLLHNTVGEPEVDPAKSKRRECIDAGNAWITNKGGSWCWRHKKASTARVVSDFGVNFKAQFGEAGANSPATARWRWLERNRCVRSGGAYWEDSKGAICFRKLSGAPE